MTCLIKLLLGLALTGMLMPALATVPQQVLSKYGGEYSAKCSDKAALRAKVTKEGLSLTLGPKSVTGVFEMEALTYLGQSPPDGYETALMSNAKQAGSIVFIVYSSKAGLWVELDVDDAVLKQLGSSKRNAGKLKRC